MRRSKFNLSHTHLLTCDMGQLVPIGVVEALPGDTMQHHAAVLARVSPLAAPIMHPVSARVHHFFVPHRLTWTGNEEGATDGDNWEDFITGGKAGNNAATPPTIATTGADEKTLLDYMGIPPDRPLIDINAMPIRAFNMIYNEYYRDEDLVNEREMDDITIPQVAWGKDYFTAARPWTQKGPDVTIPLGEMAPVATKAVSSADISLQSGLNDNHEQFNLDSSGATLKMGISGGDATSMLYADLAEAIGGNVNDVRRAFAIQRYQEARSKYGSRYTEYLRYLGVAPSDGRLQRPEFLGGGRTQLNFSEVLQTGPETQAAGGTPFGVGDMYGHGIGALRSNKYRRFIEEHGYIISCLSVRPKSIYQDGIHRSWLKTTKEEYWQKELEHIGQQEIYNNEIYADTASGMETFGYSDRYSEYREHPSLISGEFRDTLDYWHMARKFSAPPVLNQSFIDCVPTKRIYNEQTYDSLWIMVQHKMIARRMVSRSTAGRLY